MFGLQSLKINHYKNCADTFLSFNPQVNCLTGKNGSGKTNLLDAIYYLSFTRSFFHTPDQQIIQHEAGYLRVEGIYKRNELEEKVVIALQKGEKKSLKVNNNEVRKFADHIGQYPLVMITPNDIMLIHEGSEERRKFLDGMIAQTDKVYLNNLLAYNRTLEQRNRQLKVFAENGAFDETLLASYNEQLIRYGEALHIKRSSFLQEFIPVFRSYYQTISSSTELVNLIYESELNNNSLTHLLQQFEANDLAAQRTTKGIHKDDLLFEINAFPLKKYGSQGQQKSFIIALKLAQFSYLNQHMGIKPLLLLDDIFEKLDGERLKKLLSMIAHDDFGQIFITDTDLERLQLIFSLMPGVGVKYFSVNQGTIHEL